MWDKGLLPSAAAMLIFALLLLYGGLAFFITIALRAERKRMGDKG